MGTPYPRYPDEVSGGDEATFSPGKSQPSLLAAERASQRTKRIETDSSGNIFVNIAADTTGGTGFANKINTYSETLVPFATVTTILTYIVPVGQTLNVTKVIGWGDTSGEFLVQVNGITKGGGRSTAADPNFVGDYVTAPIVAAAGDMVTITAEHYNPSAKTMKANLLAGIS